jgi:hypothetical protein
MDAKLSKLLGEVSKLEERFLEAGEATDDLPSPQSAERRKEADEVAVFVQLALNSVHTAVNVVQMMLEPTHRAPLAGVLGEEDVAKIEKFGGALDEMSDFFQEAMLRFDDVEEEPEEPAEDDEPKDKEADNEEPEDEEPEEEKPEEKEPKEEKPEDKDEEEPEEK